MLGTSDRERRHLATSLLVTLAVGLSLATAPLVLAAPRLVISPSNGVRGATLKATANDFPAGPVHFTWDGSISLGTATSDGQKAILSFQIPGGASTGEHTVRACAASPCTGSDPQDDARVTVSGGPTLPPPTTTPQPTPAPTPSTPLPTGGPSPTPRITPKPAPTSRPTPIPTPRPAGVTAEPSVAPEASDEPASEIPSTVPSVAPSLASSIAPGASPAASPGGGVVPTQAPGEPTSSPGPLPAAPASETDGFMARLAVPSALIFGLILAGFLLSRIRGRASQAAVAVSAAGVGRAGGAPGDGQPTVIAPDPDDAAGVEDPWANVRTISVHVEQVEGPKD